LLARSFSPCSQAQWTFQYSYAQVTDSAADDYLFSLINAEIGLDPFTLSDQYLRPTSNLVDGLVTFRFISAQKSRLRALTLS
jgi:hypothetical protein